MIGVKPRLTHSLALNTSPANSADKPAFINTGTKTPLRIDHAVTGDGSNRFIMADKTNVMIISGIPVRLALEIKFPINAVKTVPISVALNIEMKVDAKKMSTKVLPIPSKE